MTPGERDSLRGLIDGAKRARLARAGVERRRGPKPPQPTPLVAELVAEQPKPAYRMCVYCGQPTMGQACLAHRDLLAIEANRFLPVTYEAAA